MREDERNYLVVIRYIKFYFENLLTCINSRLLNYLRAKLYFKNEVKSKTSQNFGGKISFMVILIIIRK